jgi:hypothetical protein
VDLQALQMQLVPVAVADKYLITGAVNVCHNPFFVSLFDVQPDRSCRQAAARRLAHLATVANCLGQGIDVGAAGSAVILQPALEISDSLKVEKRLAQGFDPFQRQSANSPNQIAGQGPKTPVQ